MLRSLFGWVAILALAVGSVAQLAPPSPAAAGAPADAFSAARAYRHVERLGRATHPVGSDAAAGNRRYIADTLASYGVSAHVEHAVGRNADDTGGTLLADVHDVVATIPGRAPTGRVVLVAHTDSVRVGPGGSDDGAGSAALLETARALMHGPRPRNDVVLVFTDAEEACLCGAAAYVAHHRAQARDSVVLNLEARGSSGPVVMFETSRGNADLVSTFASAPYPVGTSFAVEIYRKLPNDTDFTMFREAGFAGLNSAYLDGSAVYHTPLDTPAAMDRGSLQQHGSDAVALTRSFGGQDLRHESRAHDATYFPVAGLLVHYPGGWTWPLALLAVLLVAALVVLSAPRVAARLGVGADRRVPVGRFAAAFALAVLPIAVAAALAQGAWSLLTALRPGYAGLLTGDPYHPGWYRLAVVLLALAALAAWWLPLRRRLGLACAYAGLAWLAVLGVVLAATVPGGSYLATLPALFGAAGALVAYRWPEWATPAYVLGAVPAVLILAPTVALLFPALGLAVGVAGALLAVLAGFALLPLLHTTLPPRERGADSGDEPRVTAAAGGVATRWAATVPAGLLVLALVAGMVGFAVDGFDAAHPEPAHLTYALDADTGRAIWASSQPPGHGGAAQTWLARYVGPTRSTVDDRFPVLGSRSDGRMRTGTATAATLPAPTLTVLSTTAPDADGYRTVRLRLASARHAPIVGLYLPHGVAVRSADVAGTRMPLRRDGRWALAVTYFAVPPGGVTVTLAVRGTARARILDESDGLGALPGFRPRPAGVGVAPAHDADEAVVARTVTIPAHL
ncbi:MAG TPA: M28 family peptidase [Actinocatenispora sp.]